MTFALEISKLNKTYKSNKNEIIALDNISLSIKSGAFFGLLGPNGAGKSTFINILAGLINKTSGNVKIANFDIDTQLRESKISIGVVPQEISLDPFFTVRETLELYSEYYGIKNNTKKIDELLNVFKLEDKQNVTSRQLSGGMARRFLIAKALIHNPDIVVLDEPTAGVDIELRIQLWNYIKYLNSLGKTIILTTHYLEEAEKLCNEIAIINFGKIIEKDIKSEMIQKYGKKTITIHFSSPATDLDLSKLANLKYSAIDHHLVIFLLKIDQDYAVLTNFMSYYSEKIIDFDTQNTTLEDIFKSIIKL